MAQYNRLMSDTWIVDELKKLNKKIDAQATKGTGTIIVADPETGVETVIGTLPDGSTGFDQFVGDTTPPPVATAPFVSAQAGQFVVTWDGLFVGGAEKPRDFVHVNVIGHKMDGSTTLLSAPVGVIRLVTESVLVTLDVAGSGEYWQFSLEAVDHSGNKAAESARSASFMMLDALSPVSEAWTELNAEVLSAKNASVSAQAAADDAQDAADIVAQNLSSTAAEVTAAQLKADQAFNLAEQAADAAGDAQTAADGKTKTWYTETEPAGIGHEIGDMWFDPNNNHRLSTWDGTDWVTAQDAWLAQEIAESKGRTYTQTVAPPVEARLPQNLWIDTSLGTNLSVTKFWDATAAAGAGAWVPVKDQEINAAELRAAQDAKAKADAAAIAAINAQGYSRNPSFDDWTAAAPMWYAAWGTGSVIKETTIFQRGPYAVRFDCTDDTTDRGLNMNGVLNHAPNLEYWTVEMSFYLVSGTSLAGAGILLDWNGMTNNRTTLNLSAEIPAPITGRWYTVTKTLRRPTNATGTWTTMDGYFMANYSAGLGGRAVKDIIFDWLNIRPATAGEILAYNAPTTQYVDDAEAAAIASATDIAQEKADDARDAAIQDTTTRLAGKNKIVWSTSPATGTVGYTNGDVWFQRDGTGATIAQWEFDGAWSSRTVSDAVLGNISAGKITYGEMSGERVTANTISVDKLLVMSTDNLISEPTFTANGKAWANSGAYSIDPTGARNGGPAWKIANAAVQQGTYNKPERIPVEEGQSYRMVAYVKSDVPIPVNGVTLYVTTRTAAGAASVFAAGNSGAAGQDIVGIIPANTWTKIVATRTIPDGHVNASFGVFSQSFFSTGNLWVDFVTATRMSGGSLIVDGAIDGKIITGPTIQTDPGATTGIKLKPTELMGFDGSGNKSFSLTSGGTLSLKGEIKSGSTITGATLIGTEGIQTTPTTDRGVKMDSLGIKAWDGAGALTFSVNASTGEVEAPGIKANSIKGDKLESGSVTAEKIRIGDFTNLVTNGYGDLGTGVGFGSGLVYDTADKPSSVTGVFKSTAGQGTYGPPAILFDVDPSTEYITELWIKASLPNSRIYIELRDQAGVSSTANVILPALTSQGGYILSNAIVPTAWTKYEIRTTTGASTTKLRIGNIFFNHLNGSERNAVVSLALSIRRRAQGNLLVDGAITTNHMASGTIDAGVLVAGSITGTEIQSKAIGTDKLIISSTDNLILEADFGNNGSSWEMGTYKSIDATAGRGSTKALKITGTATAVTLKNMGNKIPISADARFRGAMWVKSSIATTANAFKIVGRFWTSNIAYTDIDIAASPAMTANTYTKVEGMVPATIPATAWAAEFYIRIANTSTTQITHVDFVSVTRAADGKLIVDGAITADKLETQLVLSTEVIAGNPALTHAKMNQSGFHVFAAQPDGSAPKEVISMGTATDDYFGITDATGASVASISSSGAMTATSLNVDKYDSTNDVGGLSIGGTQLEETIDEKGGQLLGWASRATDGLYYAGTTMHPYLSLQVDGLRAGRAYMVSTSPIHVTSDSANSDAIVKMHYLVGVDRAATVSDPVISEANSIPAGWSTGLRQPITFNRLLTPVVNGSASLLISYGVVSTGRAKITTAGVKPVIVTVTDMGWAVPETGEARNGTANAPASGSTGGETTPPASKKNYDVTWNATGLRSFEGNSPYNTYAFNASYMYSGLSPAGYGDLSSMAIFPNLTTTLSGATVTGVWVYVYYDFWYYGSGGSAYIGLHGQTALTSTRPSKTYSHAVSANWPRASGRWIKMSSTTYDGWRTGTHRGFTLGSSGGSYERYGYAHNPRLRITWTR